MPDNAELPPPENQVDWHALLHDLEKSIEVMSGSLDTVRTAMRRLVMVEPWLPQVGAILATPSQPVVAHVTPSDILEPVQDLVVPVAEHTPAVADEAHAVREEVPPVHDELPASGELLADIAIEDSEAAREAVRHAFDVARAEMVEEEFDVNVIEDLPHEALSDDEEALREAVRREVEAARVQLAEGPAVAPYEAVVEDQPAASEAVRQEVEASDSELTEEAAVASHAPVVEDQEDAREAVRREVEAARAEMAAPPAAAVHEEPQDEEAMREAVRREVAAARSEMAWSPATAAREEPQDEEGMREAVRRQVQAARGELMDYAGASPPAAERSPEDEEESREAVRRAVEEARAEMTAGRETPVKKPFFQPPARPVREVAPTLTIEDPESRVELARVYNLLKALDLAGSASLLNYTSRQVSVALAFGSDTPSPEAIASAVSETFDRQCSTVIDGINVIVKLGAEREQAA